MYEIMVAPFLKIIEILLGGAGKLKALKYADKERAADYLDHVSTCMVRIVDAATKHKFDEQAWSELRVYGEMPKSIENILDASTARGLKDEFWSLDGEMAMMWTAQIGHESDRQTNISKLAKAAGRLKGLAATLRIS
jgi:hypothetical protein